MYTIYQLQADELNESFLAALKAMFKNKEIEIAVYERDETAYLLRSPANRKRFLNAVREVEQTRNIIASKQLQ